MATKTELADQIMDAFMEASIHAITPKEYTDRILALIEQAKIQELEKLEEYYFQHDGEGEHKLAAVFIDRLKQLKDKEGSDNAEL